MVRDNVMEANRTKGGRTKTELQPLKPQFDRPTPEVIIGLQGLV